MQESKRVGERTTLVQNRGNQWLHKMDLGPKNLKIKWVVIETTGVCAKNVARGVMTLCCDITLCYKMTLRLLRYMFIGLFFQNALVDHIGVCTPKMGLHSIIE